MDRSVQNVNPPMLHKIWRRILLSEKGLIYLGFLFSVAFWFIDSWIDCTYFGHETYAQSMQPTGIELYMRLLVSFQIISCHQNFMIMNTELACIVNYSITAAKVWGIIK